MLASEPKSTKDPLPRDARVLTKTLEALAHAHGPQAEPLSPESPHPCSPDSALLWLGVPEKLRGLGRTGTRPSRRPAHRMGR